MGFCIHLKAKAIHQRTGCLVCSWFAWISLHASRGTKLLQLSFKWSWRLLYNLISRLCVYLWHSLCTLQKKMPLRNDLTMKSVSMTKHAPFVIKTMTVTCYCVMAAQKSFIWHVLDSQMCPLASGSVLYVMMATYESQSQHAQKIMQERHCTASEAVAVLSHTALCHIVQRKVNVAKQAARKTPCHWPALMMIIIQTLSSSWRARYVQDKSCLSKAACLVHPYKAY